MNWKERVVNGGPPSKVVRGSDGSLKVVFNDKNPIVKKMKKESSHGMPALGDYLDAVLLDDMMKESDSEMEQ